MAKHSEAIATIGMDLDGTLLNFGNHLSECRVNVDLIRSLPPYERVIIITNQGGMAFSETNPDKYPMPWIVRERLFQARWQLLTRGLIRVPWILVSAYHPRADERVIQRVARELRNLAEPMPVTVFTTARSRKPEPYMLKRAGISVYYGDSPEDAEAAKNAGIKFVAVDRFL